MKEHPPNTIESRLRKLFSYSEIPDPINELFSGPSPSDKKKTKERELETILQVYENLKKQKNQLVDRVNTLKNFVIVLVSGLFISVLSKSIDFFSDKIDFTTGVDITLSVIAILMAIFAVVFSLFQYRGKRLQNLRDLQAEIIEGHKNILLETKELEKHSKHTSSMHDGKEEEETR